MFRVVQGCLGLFRVVQGCSGFRVEGLGRFEGESSEVSRLGQKLLGVSKTRKVFGPRPRLINRNSETSALCPGSEGPRFRRWFGKLSPATEIPEPT